MSSKGTTVVLGAGHNGLTAAIRLARAGHKVTILERQSVAGGVAALEEFHPGYLVPGIQHGSFGVRPRLVKDLDLASHGLRLREQAAAVCVPEPEGRGLVLRYGDDQVPGGLSERSSSDATRWSDWRAELEPIRAILDALIDQAPPVLEAAGWSTLLQLAKPSLSLRRLGANAMSRILRAAPMCAEDLLNDTFEDSLLRAALASRGLEGAFLGPRSAGSGALLLMRELAGGPGVEGGPSALTNSLVAAARAAGVELQFDTEVSGILVDNGRVCAVRTSDGQELDCALVVSGLGVRRTFAACDGVIPVRQRRAAERVRARGTTAAVRLALSAPLQFKEHADTRFEFARVVDTTVALEQAFDHTKYGEFGEHPWLDIAVPSETDRELAPSGHSSVSILVHNAPFDLNGGWTVARKAELLQTVLRRLEPVSGELTSQLVASQVLAPTDLESTFSLDGGHPMHAELGLDQLWVQRPSVHLAHYRTEIGGLVLAGRGSHPGGEFLGTSGWLGAGAALARD